MRKDKFKFLTKSVLLEEEGLPRANVWIICIIAFSLFAFIFWANITDINEIINVEGVLDTSKPLQQCVLLKVPASNILDVEISNRVFVTIPGITSKDSIKGSVYRIEEGIKEDSHGTLYYEVILNLSLTERQISKLSSTPNNDLSAKADIVIGSQSLLSYILGPLWDIGEEALNY